MKRLILGLICFFYCAALFAAELNVWRLPAGLYGIQDGKIVKVNELTIDPSPTPPGPGPVPDVLTVRAKALKAAADKVADPSREETCANLAGLWELIRQQVVAGKIQGPTVIAKAIDLGNGMVLGVAQARQWKPVTDLFATQFNAQVQDNSGDAALAGYLGEAVSGLKASVPSYSCVPPKIVEKDGQLQVAPGYKALADMKAIDWNKLLDFVMRILAILLPLLS